MSEKDINNLKEMLIDFNEYSTDYTKTRCKELEKTIENTLEEIERLNKELEKYKYTADELNEIERLNNIINELEKWFDDMNLEKLATFDDYDIGQYSAYKNVLNKIKELKGSDKE